MGYKVYFVYILTNKNKTTLYVGVTNNLQRRLQEHQLGLNKGFSTKYNCHHLVYYEKHHEICNAIGREKEIKNWRREKKNALVNSFNPEWRSLQP